jgi:hypothetical protein
MTLARQHFGCGPLALRREHSVFVNCPYDPEFRPLFDAILFSVICCGFVPRCAMESGSASLSRMDRIVHAMRASKYSIHDLSRCKGDGDGNYARFNMPLELGMAMAERFGTQNPSESHDWLLLVPKGHTYMRFASDLAGYDPSQYDGTAPSIVPQVMAWLATRQDALRCPPPQAVLEALPGFQTARAELSAAWCGCEPWADLLLTAIQIAGSANLIPTNGVQPQP